MSRIIKEKAFYKLLFSIAIPIALQNLIVFSTSLADTVMLGQVSEVALSASSLANQPFFILSLICFGLSGGSSVLASQYWGKGDIKSVKTIFAIVLKAAFVISSLIGLIVLIFPAKVMGLYSSNPAIITDAVKYLRVMGFAYFFFGFSNTLLCCIRSVEIVKVSVIVNSTSFLTNVLLNWVLIFGNLGAPALGITGAALATLIARLLEFIITVIYVFVIDKKLNLRVRDLLKYKKVIAVDLLKYGSPVLLNELMWALGITLQAAILGHITYSKGDPVAANSIAGIVQQLSTIIIFGLASAAAVLVGKAIGEGDEKKAAARAHTLKYLSFVLGFGAFATILLLKGVAIDFYDLSDDTKQLTHALMTVIAFVTIFVSTSAISIVGVLRGAGDTRFCLTAEMVSLWGVAIPLALAAAFVWKLPVPLVLICMKIDEPLKVILCVIRMSGTRWLKTLTRSEV